MLCILSLRIELKFGKHREHFGKFTLGHQLDPSPSR